jgi:hypothetical protein
MSQASTLWLACVMSVIGGAGNGVQWVSTISAVQELTVEGMQARVMSVLESIGAAMPGIGFAAGGVIATVASPRTTFLVAGVGLFAIVLAAAPALGRNWSERAASSGSSQLDEGDDVVLELIPGSSPIRPEREV